MEFDNPTVRVFRDSVDAATKRMRDRGLEREALVILAGILQEHLACDNLCRRLPYSQPLEVLMRVVAALLDGHSHTSSYVRGKFQVGMGCLLHALEEKSSSHPA